MNYLEITFSDGSVARWLIPDDTEDLIGKVEDAVVQLLGSPDSLKT